MKKLVFSLFYFIFCNICIIAAKDSKNIESKLKIAVSIEPLAFFIDQIAKEKASVNVIVPSNKNAETFELDFKNLIDLENAQMFLGIGIPFEKIWIDKALKIRNSKKDSKDIKILALDKIINKNSHDTHSHATNLHLWLSLKNAKIIAKEITLNLANLDSINANFYNENLQILLQNIESLESKIKEITKEMPKKDFIVYHPLFDAYASEYNLIEHSLEIHGKKYGLQDILNLSNFAKKIGIKRIFTQTQNKDIKTLATSINATLITINPMSRDYLNNLESMLKEIAKSYK